MNEQKSMLGGEYKFPATTLTVRRIGFGPMQLAGPGVWGPPKDPNGAIELLRHAAGVGGS
jgi:pyridoxine 4-dehydrogenase